MTLQQLRILRDLREQARRHGLALRPFVVGRLRAVCDPAARAELRTALDLYLQHPDFRGALRQRRAA